MVLSNGTAALAVRPRPGFVETPFVGEVTARALAYIEAGFPIHFRGPSGSGKTTMALHVAHRMGRPVLLICGDEEFGSSDLIGGQFGYRRRRVVDNFVHSVLKTEEDVSQQWVDHRLTEACRDGLVVVYDEFNRSRPEANNVLLSVLEERILVLPRGRDGTSYLKVHPNFVAILTSNPDDYSGVHRTQDALRDRLITLDLDYFDRDTEVGITRARSDIAAEDAPRIVDLVRACREAAIWEAPPTVRSCVMIARVLALRHARAVVGDPVFERTCVDVLAAKTPRQREALIAALAEHCPEEGTPR